MSFFFLSFNGRFFRLEGKTTSLTFPSSSLLRMSDASPLHSSFRTDSSRPIRIFSVLSSGVVAPPPAPPAAPRREESEIRLSEKRESEGRGRSDPTAPAPAPAPLLPASKEVILRCGERGDERCGAKGGGEEELAAEGACSCEEAPGSSDEGGGGDGVAKEEEGSTTTTFDSDACSPRPSAAFMARSSTLSSRASRRSGERPRESAQMGFSRETRNYRCSRFFSFDQK